jgi:hypothetical protein
VVQVRGALAPFETLRAALIGKAEGLSAGIKPRSST